MFRRIYGVCKISLKKTLRHSRVLFLLILLFICMDYSMRGIRNFCLYYSVKISIFEMLVQMFGNAKMQGYFLLFYAFLLTDMPGADLSEQYVLVRSGVWTWIFGKMIEAILLAFGTILLISIYTVLIVREIDFSTQWSRAAITLARTNACKEFGILAAFDDKIITNYALTTAFPLCMVLNITLMAVGGLWIVLINLVVNRSIGSFVLASAAFMNMSIGGILHTGAIYKISPASLALLSVIDGGLDKAYPSLRYAILFFCAAFVLAISLMMIAVKGRKDYSRFR